MNRLKTFFFLTVGSCLGVSASGQSVFSTEAFNSGTIEEGGDSGAEFLNAQGPSNFQEYGISSFSLSSSDFGLSEVSGLTSATITYTQSNIFFTSDGSVELFLSFDSTVSDSDYSSLNHSTSGNGIDDSQFSDSPSAQLIGSGNFSGSDDPDTSGTEDVYTLDLTGFETDMIAAINNNESFSIILASDETGTAATYAGVTNDTYAGPTLTVTAVPEPSTYAALLGLAGFGLVLWRRRRG